MNKYSSSINRDQLRHIKYNTSPQQRMNWLMSAIEFAREKKVIRKTKKDKER